MERRTTNTEQRTRANNGALRGSEVASTKNVTTRAKNGSAPKRDASKSAKAAKTSNVAVRGRAVPRPFAFHWGGGNIVEEACFRGKYTEPAVQLLEYEGHEGHA